MRETFRWNPYADQPHNVFPQKERFWHHLRHAESYLSLLSSNLKKAAPGLSLYRQYRQKMFEIPVEIQDPFAVSVSPADDNNEKMVKLLQETGVKKTLVRIPSWEEHWLGVYQKFLSLLAASGMEVTVALLQQRADVLDISRWKDFLDRAFSRFRGLASFFEVGHAWNRTKWGVWDFQEYLKLAEAAVPLAEKYGVKLVGPAVIDFEFHLYPPVLEKISFDRISSLLYVDRVGAPENSQFGWDTARKIALLKAVVDVCNRKGAGLWITEVNWPLEGTGKYSPASGKPNVSEEKQADYLVRYFVLCLSSGFVERIYWWQLVAPGYGLIDSRGREWRKRPGFYAFQNLARLLRDSTFLRKEPHPDVEIFHFAKGGERFAACWQKKGKPVFFEPPWPEGVRRVVNRDGQEMPHQGGRIPLDGSPKYLFLS